MSHYLIVYDRPHGELLRLERFTDSRQALDARFGLERGEFRGRDDIEIVVLGADSAAQLMVTHSRYFGQRVEIIPLEPKMTYDRLGRQP